MIHARTIAATVSIVAVGLAGPSRLPAATTGNITIRVVDHDTGKPIAVRMHLKNEKGVATKPPRVPFWKDHFVFDGEITLKLPTGEYTFEMERGPEYKLRGGQFTIDRDSADARTLEMYRFVDMKKEGWWAGELHIHRPVEDVELLMRAEDLHVGPVITWWNAKNLWQGKPLPETPLVKFDTNRFYHALAGEDEREGGALLYFNLPEPLPITDATREYPSPVEFLKLARNHDGVHVDIEKPFWWDMPIWIASGMVDSIGLCNNHMHRDGMYESEAWGKPRDTRRLAAPRGNGQWSEEIYYHLLNCGIRLPPSAGSASGVLNNPVGYNRVYVHCGDELTYENWWQGLRAGRVVVTNGPMLRASANDQLPGHVFRAAAGGEIELEVAANLSLRDPADYIEIIKNGQVAESVRLDDWVKNNGQLPKIKFQESGWLSVRVLTSNEKTYRFASTGPFYVEIGEKQRISKSSAQFFVDWVKERTARVKLDDAEQRGEVLKYHQAALEFWQRIADSANAE